MAELHTIQNPQDAFQTFIANSRRVEPLEGESEKQTLSRILSVDGIVIDDEDTGEPVVTSPLLEYFRAHGYTDYSAFNWDWVVYSPEQRKAYLLAYVRNTSELIRFGDERSSYLLSAMRRLYATVSSLSADQLENPRLIGILSQKLQLINCCIVAINNVFPQGIEEDYEQPLGSYLESMEDSSQALKFTLSILRLHESPEIKPGLDPYIEKIIGHDRNYMVETTNPMTGELQYPGYGLVDTYTTGNLYTEILSHAIYLEMYMSSLLGGVVSSECLRLTFSDNRQGDKVGIEGKESKVTLDTSGMDKATRYLGLNAVSVIRTLALNALTVSSDKGGGDVVVDSMLTTGAKDIELAGTPVIDVPAGLDMVDEDIVITCISNTADRDSVGDFEEIVKRYMSSDSEPSHGLELAVKLALDEMSDLVGISLRYDQEDEKVLLYLFTKPGY